MTGPKGGTHRFSLHDFLGVQFLGRAAGNTLRAEAGPWLARRCSVLLGGVEYEFLAAFAGLLSKAQLPRLFEHLQLGIIVELDCSVLGTS